MGGINAVDWFQKKLNWSGCAYQPLWRSVHCSLRCWWWSFIIPVTFFGRWDMAPGSWWAALAGGTWLWEPCRLRRGKLDCMLLKISYCWAECSHLKVADFILVLTDSKEQSPWEANQFSSSQEIPCIFTAFTIACHLFLAWASCIHSIPPLPKDPS